jgi:hypothetical protein
MHTYFGEKAVFGREAQKEERTAGRKSNTCEGSMQGEHARKKGQLEGRETCAREACEASMQGRNNDARVRVFVMYCNG